MHLFSAPPHVAPPVVEAIQGGTITLGLHRASEKNGPISHYHIVVVPVKSGGLSKMPSDFNMEEVCGQMFL